MLILILIPIIGSILSQADCLTNPIYESIASIIFIATSRIDRGSTNFMRMVSTKTTKEDKKPKATTKSSARAKKTKGESSFVKSSFFNSLLSKYSKFYLNCNNNLKYCYIIPFIFKSLGKEIPADAEPIVTFSFNILILALIILFCFINITGYFISIYLINKYNVESRYPKYYKIIRYFEQSRILFVTIEIFLCLFCLIIIIILNLGILGIFIFV